MADILIQRRTGAGINPAPETEKRGKRKNAPSGDDTPSGKKYFKDKKMRDIKPKDIIQWQNKQISYRDEKGKPYAPTYLKKRCNQS